MTPATGWRIGLGHDTHRLVRHRKLMLGGIEVPHEVGAIGHSDADVLLHAVIDALLGGVALGDIGEHFPDSSAELEGIDSTRLLKQVLERVSAAGWEPANVDCTIHAQRPKLAPYKPAIRERLASLIGLPLEAVNVKAKTGEKVGPIGREEAISADAVVLLRAQATPAGTGNGQSCERVVTGHAMSDPPAQSPVSTAAPAPSEGLPSIRVYNTLTRQKEPFRTVVPGRVAMYLCGPTVYKPSHIGHMVGPVIFDTIKRYLTYCGYEVRFVINITDVDDKLIAGAKQRNTTVEALAREMTRDYFDNLETMGIDTVDHFPYATEHIAEMQQLIASLIERGHAYPLDGDVYFQVTTDGDYGKLSGRRLEELVAGTRVEANDRKRHPADFALWKAAREGEPSWPSPWGPGRPGWHIECSAMSMKYLGETLDIHGGGLDLMFPHHENELAQSESCTGKTFARYWLHNGLMQAGKSAGKVGGAHDRRGDVADADEQVANKLAGSKGAASVKELFATHHPETVRFFLLSTHYRSPIDFSDENIAQVGRSLEGFAHLFEAYQRISGRSFYQLTTPARRGPLEFSGEPAAFYARLAALRERFFEAMDDDFNTGGAIGALFELRSLLNAYIHDARIDAGIPPAAQVTPLTHGLTVLKELANLLGVFRRPARPSATGAAGGDDAFAARLMELVLSIRAEARKSRNFAVSDKIRDELNALKVVVTDRPDGTIWKRG